MAEDVTSNASTSRPGSPVGSLPGGFSANNSRQPSFRFTWDPAQKRRVGPGSVSGYSEADSRADFINTGPSARQEILNLASANLSLAALGSEWSSAKHGFHAISTVLNHPTKRAAPPKAHSSLSPVPPADLPRAKRKDFDPYLKDIAPEWEKFEKNLKTKERGQSDGEINDAMSTSTEEPLSPVSPSESMGSTRTTRPNRSLPSLEIVPEIFFAPQFNMGDPNTFSIVTEQSILLERNSSDRPIDLDPASISYSLPLLEKLSHYADTVEQHLVREIQARSASFFSALTNLHDLQSESSRCIRRISELKEMLNEVNEKQSKRGLEVVRGNAKLMHLERLRDGVEFVKEVNDMKGIAHQLQEGGEWSAALNVVENVNTLWDYKTPKEDNSANQLPTVEEESPRRSVASASDLPPALQYISLPSIRAFGSLPDELHILMTQIASTLTSEFASVAQQDLILRNDNGFEENFEEDQAFRERLTPLIIGLAKTGPTGVKESMDKWREVVMGEVRRAVKKHLDVYVTEIDEGTGDVDGANNHNRSLDVPLRERSASLANSLTAMGNEDFLKILRQIFASLLWGLKGAFAQSQTFMDITRSPSDFQAILSRIDASSLRTACSDILFAATELAHNRVSKVIGIRAEQNSKLKLREFHAFFEEAWAFVVDSEVLCQGMVVGLRGVLGGQSKAFLQAFHADRLTKSAKMVEDEQWTAVEVSPRSQRLVDVIVESAVQDALEIVFEKATTQTEAVNVTTASPSDLNETTPEVEPTTKPNAISTSTQPQAASTNGSKEEKPAKANAKYVTIEDRAFYVVSATVQVLGLVIDYLKLMVNLHALTMESMSRLVEFLKAFNSRTCQVVLGAGAMRSAGLRNITARNLALASQSLSVMTTLIPYIRETYRRHLNPKQAVMLIEFDKLKRDYQEHQNEIHAKLISIMSERLSTHCRALQEIQWDDLSAQSPNEYMQQLVKETVTLHKVLTRYLGPVASEPIMSEVFASINHRLGEEYQKIPLPSPESKERMLFDARFLHESFSALRGVGALSNMLETIVQEKPIMRKSVLNPNGVANGGTPRPRGSIDLQPQNKTLSRQNTTGGSPLSNTVAAASNIASRPSPFAKRGFANLFGGANNNANASASNLASGPSTREGSPGPTPLGTGLTLGSSGAGTPEVEGRITPRKVPSPPGTPNAPGSNPTASTREDLAQNSSPRGSLGFDRSEAANGL